MHLEVPRLKAKLSDRTLLVKNRPSLHDTININHRDVLRIIKEKPRQEYNFLSQEDIICHEITSLQCVGTVLETCASKDKVYIIFFIIACHCRIASWLRIIIDHWVTAVKMNWWMFEVIYV